MNRFFKRSEFACHCGCGFNVVDAELLKVLTDTRKYFNSPITITSGCRCRIHNVNIRGSDNSFHTRGIAADIKVKRVVADEVYRYLDRTYPDSYGLGKYLSWTHIDVRPTKARWSK